jgi:outer membrane lipoprotein-sorting protein
MQLRIGFVLLGWMTLVGEVAGAQGLAEAQMVTMLKTIDERMESSTDYKAVAILEDKRPDGSGQLYQLEIYRRDKDDALIMLYTKPKTEAGKGYLRLEKNFWFYDPGVGKWDRRTEREKISDTGARRRDFDDWDLAQEYVPTYVGQEKLGAFTAHQLKLTARPNIEVAYPLQMLWVDQQTGNPLKLQSMALSGKVMSTTFYPKWAKAKVPGGSQEVYFPKEIRIYDEIEKGRQTIVLVQEVDLRPLAPNLFTKAWLESKSR